LVTPTGGIVGTGDALEADMHRVKSVVVRIVRGLLWHHYRIKTDSQTAFNLHVDADTTPILETLLLTRISSLGGTTFQYRHGIATDDPGSSIWWLLFYEHRHFVVIVSSKLALEVEKTRKSI
jgi:hypothetical protein